MQNINKHKKRKLEDTELGRNSRSHQKRWKGAAAKATNESDYFSLAKPEVRLDGGPQIEFGSVDCLPDLKEVKDPSTSEETSVQLGLGVHLTLIHH